MARTVRAGIPGQLPAGGDAASTPAHGSGGADACSTEGKRDDLRNSASVTPTRDTYSMNQTASTLTQGAEALLRLQAAATDGDDGQLRRMPKPSEGDAHSSSSSSSNNKRPNGRISKDSGKKRRSWTIAMESMIVAAVAEYSTSWKRIRADPKYANVLGKFSETDLARKWYRLKARPGRLHVIGSDRNPRTCEQAQAQPAVAPDGAQRAALPIKLPGVLPPPLPVHSTQVQHPLPMPLNTDAPGSNRADWVPLPPSVFPAGIGSIIPLGVNGGAFPVQLSLPLCEQPHGNYNLPLALRNFTSDANNRHILGIWPYVQNAH